MDTRQLDSRISELFDSYVVDFVGDVAFVNYNKYSTELLEQFIPVRELFCDNIIIKIPINYNKVLNGIFIDLRSCISYVYIFLRDIGLKYFNVSFLAVTNNDNFLPSSVYATYGQRFDTFSPGSASFKVSLSGEPFYNVVNILRTKNSSFHSNFLFVYDIDIAIDCAGTFSRAEIEQFLLLKGVKQNNIFNDVNKNGNNYISWKMVTSYDISLTFKLYNKFVQMLESSEVRKYIGSRISELVANSNSTFKQTLNDCKSYGMTRLEIKALFSSLYDYDDYLSLMNEFLSFMHKCKVYKTSFEYQWKALVDEIDNKNVLAIYISNRKIFAYCHWYNSLTSKKQGCIKQNITESKILNLLTNYSFNIGHIRNINVEDNGQYYNIISNSYYRRVKPGITLVPGPLNSLYPQRHKINPEISTSFADVGLVEYKGINLEWPERTKILSEIEEVVDDQFLKDIISINNREYKFAHKLLSKYTKYKVVAMRFGIYRNTNVVYVILYIDGNINPIKTKFGEHGVHFFRSINTTTFFYIKTGNFIYNNTRNVVDLEVCLY